MNYVIEKNFLLQEKRVGNNSNIIDEEIVSIFNELLEYKRNNPTQHKKSIKVFIPI